MVSRRYLPFVAFLSLASMGASYRTTNFVVQAPTEQIARQAGEYAEKWRREKALEWIGQEMPAWGQPCPLKVTITPGGAGGYTTFAFDRGAILSQEMNVQGTLERVLHSVLPHEVTHTVFAYKFRCPVPRWADEGGAVLSEDDAERKRHDQMVRQSLAGGKAFRLRTLFEMKQYPSGGEDLMTLYAQGYSLSRFLVESTSKPQFLAFVGDGMRSGWDQAIRTHLRMNSVEQLEETWLSWMRGTFRARGDVLAKNTKENSATDAAAFGREPKASPVIAELGRPEPVVRGASPDESSSRDSSPPARGEAQRKSEWSPAHAPARSREQPSQAQQAVQFPPR
jgi:hypothetical protein